MQPFGWNFYSSRGNAPPLVDGNVSPPVDGWKHAAGLLDGCGFFASSNSFRPDQQKKSAAEYCIYCDLIDITYLVKIKLWRRILYPRREDCSLTASIQKYNIHTQKKAGRGLREVASLPTEVMQNALHNHSSEVTIFNYFKIKRSPNCITFLSQNIHSDHK